MSRQLEAEAALLEYSVSVIVPELSKKLFKQGLISKTLIGKRDVPTPQALVKEITESLSYFHLGVFTLIYYLNPACIHAIENLKRAVHQSTRESCNLLHKTANALLAKLTAPAEESAINDGNADEILEIYCDEFDCGVECDEDGHIACLGLGRNTWHQGKNITWSGLFASLSSGLDECNYDALLSAVIFTADAIIPSSPCFAEVIDARLIDFVRWSLDVNTCSLQAFITNEVKAADVNNAHLSELRCAIDSGSLGSIKNLAGYRKTAKGLRLVRQFQFPFSVLARLKELKENAGMRVDVDNITPMI